MSQSISNAVSLMGKIEARGVSKAGTAVSIELHDSNGMSQDLLLDYQTLICMAENIPPGRAVEITVFDSNGTTPEVRRQMKSYSVSGRLSVFQSQDPMQEIQDKLSELEFLAMKYRGLKLQSSGRSKMKGLVEDISHVAETLRATTLASED